MAVTEKDGGQPREHGAAIERAGEQGLLFGEDLAAHPENVGYRHTRLRPGAGHPGYSFRTLGRPARVGQ